MALSGRMIKQSGRSIKKASWIYSGLKSATERQWRESRGPDQEIRTRDHSTPGENRSEERMNTSPT
jgi:hypothetical protein